MVVAWSLLVTPMAILARYFKHAVKTWFKFHMIINLIALLSVIASFILILISKTAFHLALPPSSPLHYGLGLVWVVLTILYVVCLFVCLFVFF